MVLGDLGSGADNSHFYQWFWALEARELITITLIKWLWVLEARELITVTLINGFGRWRPDT